MFAFPKGVRSLFARANHSPRTSNGRKLRTGRSQSIRRVGAAFLISLWLAAFVTPPASFASNPSALTTATVPTVGSACPSVIFIGARGSGEKDAYIGLDANGKKVRKDSGLGPELDAVYDQMSGYLAARNVSVKSLFVVYPAANVNVLFLSKKEQTVLAALLLTGSIPGLAAFAASYVVNHVNVYLASIDVGLKSATDELTTEAAQCPDARFVLGGYSQGALVMHELLLRLSDKNDASSQALLGRITATVLIADPERKSNTAAMHYGTADPRAQGIKSFLTVGERDVPTPSTTYDVCNLGDMVCDFSWAIIVDKTSATAGFNVHTLSYQKNPMGIGSKIAATLMQQLPARMDHLNIAPATATVAPGAPQTFTATAMDPSNKPLGDVTAGTTFSIAPDGSCAGAVCTASVLGVHTVTGMNNGVTGTATLNVQAIPTGPAGLYWANNGDGTIGEANTDGTGVTTLVPGQYSAIGVAVNSGHVYWTTYRSGTISQANLDGTGVTTLVTGQSTPYGVAVDSSHIYWANQNGTIMTAHLDGTGVTPLVTGQPDPIGVAVDSSHIYWTDPGSGTIMTAHLDGTGVTTLVTLQPTQIGQLLLTPTPIGIAVDSSHIYWTDNHSGTISEANLDGTGVTTLVTGQSTPVGVAVDSSHIYWTGNSTIDQPNLDGTIKEANLDGTGVTTLVTGLYSPSLLAVGPQ